MVLIMESNPVYGLSHSDDSESDTDLDGILEPNDDVAEGNCNYQWKLFCFFKTAIWLAFFFPWWQYWRPIWYVASILILQSGKTWLTGRKSDCDMSWLRDDLVKFIKVCTKFAILKSLTLFTTGFHEKTQ